jgi:hypothetical protein
VQCKEIYYFLLIGSVYLSKWMMEGLIICLSTTYDILVNVLYSHSTYDHHLSHVYTIHNIDDDGNGNRRNHLLHMLHTSTFVIEKYITKA